MTTPNVFDVLAQSSGGYWKFDTVGDKYSGHITAVEVLPEKEFNLETQKMKDGKPVFQLKITVADDTDGVEQATYVKGIALGWLKEALNQTNSDAPEVGGWIGQAYTEESKYKNGQKMKVFKFAYKPPAPAPAAAAVMSQQGTQTRTEWNNDEPPF